MVKYKLQAKIIYFTRKIKIGDALDGSGIQFEEHNVLHNSPS